MTGVETDTGVCFGCLWEAYVDYYQTGFIPFGTKMLFLGLRSERPDSFPRLLSASWRPSAVPGAGAQMILNI